MGEVANGYFRPENLDEFNNGAAVIARVNELTKLALRDGYLEDDVFYAGDWSLGHAQRRVFTKTYSWFIPNRTWVLSIYNYIIKNDIHSVLEVAAGTGFAAELVTRFFRRNNPNYKLEWICTDEEPPPRLFRSVEKCTAQQAAESHKDCDMLFFAWWPYEGDPGDLEATESFVEKDKPVVIVGEGWGGCTGSIPFWAAATGKESWRYDPDSDDEGEVPSLSIEYMDWGIDSFDGINDQTYLVSKRKMNA